MTATTILKMLTESSESATKIVEAVNNYDNEKVSRLAAFELLKTVQGERDEARRKAAQVVKHILGERDQLLAVVKDNLEWLQLNDNGSQAWLDKIVRHRNAISNVEEVK